MRPVDDYAHTDEPPKKALGQWKIMTLIRVYRTIRSAHMERLPQFVEGTLVYTRRNYDYDPAVEKLHLVKKASLLKIVRIVTSPSVDMVETNEPLHFRAWPTTIPLLIAVQLAKTFRRRNLSVGSYAIENLDPMPVVVRKTRMPARLAKPAFRLISSLIISRYDKLAFGSRDSQTLYQGYSLKPAARLFEAVPSVCQCGLSTEKRQHSFAFIGSFEKRKGIDTVMEAWSILSQDTGWDGTLTIMGKGAMLPQVQAFADSHVNSVVLRVDPPREDIHKVLRETERVVLMSRSTPEWTEQVGLPIVEGLAHGAQIIASEGTGISTWLAANGHVVLPESSQGRDLADIFLALLNEPHDAAFFQSLLPDMDNRVAADRWLNSR